MIESWAEPESVIGAVGSIMRFGTVTIKRMDSPEHGIIEPVDVEGAMGCYLLRCAYRQVNPLYAQWDPSVPPLPHLWMQLLNPEKEDLLEQATFHEEWSLPVPVNLAKFPGALWPNRDFPATTAIGELQYPVRVISGNGDGGMKIFGGASSLI